MRALIYYPYLRPPIFWIKQSLLYWDRICSITPENFNDSMLNPDLIWLRNEGIYEPLQSVAIDKAKIPALEQEILDYLRLHSHISIRADDWTSTGKEKLYYGKIPENIEGALRKEGYLKATKGYLEVNSSLFGFLLCLISKYLSKSLSERGS